MVKQATREEMERELARLREALAGAEQELRTQRELAEKYRLVADHTYDWEYWLGPNGRLLYVSPSAERITGFRPEELLADPGLILATAHPLDRPRLQRHLEEIRASNESQSFDYRLITRQGETRWISHCCNQVVGPGGACLGWRASNRDITARNAAVGQLARLAQLLQAIREIQSLYIRDSDMGSTFTTLLNTLVSLTDSEYGFLDEVLYREDGTPYKLSLALSDISWDENSRRLYDELRARNLEFSRLDNLSGLPARSGEIVIANEAGQDRRAGGLPPGHPPIRSFMGLPLYFSGKLVGVAGVANRPGGYTQEVADFLKPLLSTCAGIILAFRREQADREREAALEQSESRYRQLLDTLQEGIWVIDAEARTTFVNPRLAQMLGYRVEEMLGRHLFEFMDDEGRRLCAEKLERRRQGVEEQHEFTFLRSNGDRVYTLLQTAPLLDPEGHYTGAIAGLQDVTFRKQAEAEIRRHTAELTAMNAIGVAVNRSLDVHEVLEAALEATMGVLGVAGGVLCSWDAAARGFSCVCHRGVSQDLLRTAASPGAGVGGQAPWLADGSSGPGVTGLPAAASGPACRAAEAGRPLLVPDLARGAGEGFWPAAAGEGWRGCAAIPVRTGENTAAVLLLLFRRPDCFQAGDEEFFIRVGRQIGAALEKAQLHGDVKGSMAALRASEERYRALVESSSEHIFMLGQDGTYLSSNRERAHPSLRPGQSLVGRNVADFHAPEVTGLYLRNLEQVFETGQAVDFEHDQIEADGLHFHFDTLYPIRRHGRVWAAGGICRDISERKRAESEIARFKTIFEHANFGVAIAELEGRLTYVNPFFAELHGFEPAEVLGRGLDVFFAPDQMKRVLELRQIVLAKGSFEDEEVWHRRRDGSVFPMAMNGLFVRDRQGKPEFIAVAALDITARKAAEAEVKRYTGQLEEMVEARTRRIQEMERERVEHEKLAATGRMAARIAHEVNNPLAGIKNAFLLIRDAVPQEHPHHRYLHRIEVEIERISRIIGQMFDLYRPEEEERRPCRVDEVVGDVAALLEGECQGRQVTLEVESRGGRAPVRLQEGLFRQVLYNLAQNALDASEKGGRILVATEVREGRLALIVTDHGCGIPEDVGPHIFEPFFTTKENRSRRNLGLGLSIAKTLVELLGGTIDFTSEPRDGTTFRVEIPVPREG